MELIIDYFIHLLYFFPLLFYRSEALTLKVEGTIIKLLIVLFLLATQLIVIR